MNTYTYTMTNKETGTAVTSQETSLEICKKMVALGKKHDKKGLISFVINNKTVEIKAAKIHEKIEKIFNDPLSKIGTTGLNLINKKSIRKIDQLSWELYWLRGCRQATTPNAYSDSRVKNW